MYIKVSRDVDNLKKIANSSNANATLIVLSDSAENFNLIEASLAAFEGRFTVWHTNIGRLPASDLEQNAVKMVSHIEQLSIKRASLIALDGACNLGAFMLAHSPQIVRRAVFVDPPGRSQPGLFPRLREKLQSACPIPLPFRLDADIMDLRHLEHRLTCPLLIIETAELGPEWSKQCRELASRAPNAWHQPMESISVTSDSGKPQLAADFLKLIEEFIEVPSKRSQKNAPKAESPAKASPTKSSENADSGSADAAALT